MSTDDNNNTYYEDCEECNGQYVFADRAENQCQGCETYLCHECCEEKRCFACREVMCGECRYDCAICTFSFCLRCQSEHRRECTIDDNPDPVWRAEHAFERLNSAVRNAVLKMESLEQTLLAAEQAQRVADLEEAVYVNLASQEKDDANNTNTNNTPNANTISLARSPDHQSTCCVAMFSNT